MNDKGFTDNKISIKTPNDTGLTEKPLKTYTNNNRVDINVLKSKLQDSENKEFRKNLSILSILIFGLGILGIYLSF